MIERGQGHIVTVGSVLGLMGAAQMSETDRASYTSHLLMAPLLRQPTTALQNRLSSACTTACDSNSTTDTTPRVYARPSSYPDTSTPLFSPRSASRVLPSSASSHPHSSLKRSSRTSSLLLTCKRIESFGSRPTRIQLGSSALDRVWFPGLFEALRNGSRMRIFRWRRMDLREKRGCCASDEWQGTLDIYSLVGYVV